MIRFLLISLDLLYGFFIASVIFISLYAVIKNVSVFNKTVLTVILIIAEVLFTLIGPAIGFMRYDMYGQHIPFAKQHVWIIIMLVASSSGAFWLSRCTERTNNLFLRMLLSAGMLQGILLCFAVTIHFGGYLPLGMVFPWMGFELLSPLVALFLLFRQLYFYNKIETEALLPYREELGMVPLTVALFRQPLIVRLFVYGIFVIAFVALQMAACYALGLQPDSIVRAFTESRGFTFSR